MYTYTVLPATMEEQKAREALDIRCRIAQLEEQHYQEVKQLRNEWHPLNRLMRKMRLGEHLHEPLASS